MDVAAVAPDDVLLGAVESLKLAPMPVLADAPPGQFVRDHVHEEFGEQQPR